MNICLKVISAIVLLVVPVWFGYLTKTTEMGLSILAGALGLAFSNLDKISEFSGAGFSAKMKEQVQAVIDKETEVSPEREGNEASISNSKETKVLKALADPKYTWRTLSGLSKDTGLNESELLKMLTLLVGNELAQCANKNKTGEMIWSLTTLGRVHAA